MPPADAISPQGLENGCYLGAHAVFAVFIAWRETLLKWLMLVRGDTGEEGTQTRDSKQSDGLGRGGHVQRLQPCASTHIVLARRMCTERSDTCCPGSFWE